MQTFIITDEPTEKIELIWDDTRFTFIAVRGYFNMSMRRVVILSPPQMLLTIKNALGILIDTEYREEVGKLIAELLAKAGGIKCRQ